MFVFVKFIKSRILLHDHLFEFGFMFKLYRQETFRLVHLFQSKLQQRNDIENTLVIKVFCLPGCEATVD